MLRKLSCFMFLALVLMMSGCIISGTVTDEEGTGVVGVEIIVHGQEGNLTTYTDINGKYSFGNLLPQKYTITPLSEEHTFTPASKTVQVFNVTTRINFIATEEGECTDSETESCYTGPPGTGDVGECSAGTRTCTSGVWSACVGDVTPVTEVCDDELDNDCDGTVDGNDTDCCPPLIWEGTYSTTDHGDSLDDLSGYTSVTGHLYITSTSLTNLEGLECLTSVGSTLTITGNDFLTNLEGLMNLTSVGADLRIANNDSPTNLVGLENLTSVGTDLYIANNNSLINLAALSNITSVGEDLYIQGNESLTTLGLDSLNDVGDDFMIFENIILPVSLAEALRDQVLAGDGIGGEEMICDNLGGDFCIPPP